MDVPNWVWVVLAGAHLLMLGWALNTRGWQFPDSDRYIQAAENLQFLGELYARPWSLNLPVGQAVQEFTIRPIGYPAVIVMLGRSVKMLLVLQGLLSLLNIGLVLRWWARRMKPTAGQWGIALALVLTFPAQLIYANAVMSEIALQSTVMGVFCCCVSATEGKQVKKILGLAAFAALALLLKPVFSPLAALVGLAGIGVAWWHRKLMLALVGLLPLVVMVLYMEWNEQRTGYFHYSSITEINLLHYNAAGIVRQLHGPVAEEAWVAGVLREAGAQPTFAARQRLIAARAEQVLWAHPLLYARQHAQGMMTMLLDPGRFDITQFLQLSRPPGGGLLAQVRAGELWTAVKGLPLRLLGLLGIILAANVARLGLAIRGFRRLGRGPMVERYGRWMAVGLVAYVALLTGPLGAARFLVPVWPLLLGLALVGLGSPRGSSPLEEQAAPLRKA